MERLVLPGTLDALKPLGAYIQAASKAAGLTAKQAYGLRLAMDEVATNIVTHGYEEHGLSGGIVIEGMMTDAELTLSLEDTSPPFDPRTLLTPAAEDLARPLEEREIGGLGVFLAFKALDRFDYQRTAAGNRNLFTMFRPAVGPGQARP
jgi:serine/threonine-protein kinase RsbW